MSVYSIADSRKFNYLIAGKKAFKFVYEVKLSMEITVESVINDRNQLVVQEYKIMSQPNYFGQVFDYRGRWMPHKTMY